MQMVLRKLIRGVDHVNWLCGWVLAALLLIMTVLISWQVFARYVMGNSLSFSEEVARFSMAWLTMLGTAYAYRHGSLIAVDMLAARTGGRCAKGVNLIIAVASGFFAWVLLKEGLNITELVATQTAPGIRVSMSWLYASVPAGAAVVMINAFAIISENFIEKKD